MTGLRARLKYLLGTSFPGAFLGCRQVAATDLDGWLLEDLRFETEDEEIPAWFLRPPAGQAPVPALVYAHAHGKRYHIGRTEFLDGRPAMQGPYAPDLRRLGCAALCLEMPSFGARAEPAEEARTKSWLWRGGTLIGQMLAEQQAGLDWLTRHPSIDPQRIGAMGFSMGSTLSFWLAALDERVAAAVALCSMSDLAHLVASGGHDRHGLYMTVPGLLNAARTGQIVGLTAPRSLLIGAGMEDWSTPPEAFAVARADIEMAYADAGAPERIVFHVEPAHGHEETPEMRLAVLDFLEAHLVRPSA